MAYVYRHLRKDTNEVFYIGIGKLKRRITELNGRNEHWKIIVESVGFIAEKIEDNLTWEAACEREKYWIEYYGRLDLKKGQLVNRTNGGNGDGERSDDFKLKLRLMNLGKVLSTEHKAKISNSTKGRKISDEHKKKIKYCINW